MRLYSQRRILFVVNTVSTLKCLWKNINLEGEVEDIGENEEQKIMAESLGRQE